MSTQDYPARIAELEKDIEARRQRVGVMEHGLLIQKQYMYEQGIGVTQDQEDTTGDIAIRNGKQRDLKKARAALNQVESECEALKAEYAAVEVKDFTERGRKASHIIIGGHEEALDFLQGMIEYVQKCNEASDGLDVQCVQLQSRHKASPYMPFGMLHLQVEPLYRLREQIVGAVETAREGLNYTNLKETVKRDVTNATRETVATAKEALQNI